jgi:hypothetical protein
MFGIKEDFFVKPCIDKKWKLELSEELPLLKFGNGDEYEQTCVIVKKGNKPIIVRKKRFTLVLALDCVKICFIFDNSKHMNGQGDKKQINF